MSTAPLPDPLDHFNAIPLKCDVMPERPETSLRGQSRRGRSRPSSAKIQEPIPHMPAPEIKTRVPTVFSSPAVEAWSIDYEGIDAGGTRKPWNEKDYVRLHRVRRRCFRRATDWPWSSAFRYFNPAFAQRRTLTADRWAAAPVGSVGSVMTQTKIIAWQNASNGTRNLTKRPQKELASSASGIEPKAGPRYAFRS